LSSRACLGKTIEFSINSGRGRRFSAFPSVFRRFPHIVDRITRLLLLRENGNSCAPRSLCTLRRPR
jgi:hypothetical protein